MSETNEIETLKSAQKLAIEQIFHMWKNEVDAITKERDEAKLESGDVRKMLSEMTNARNGWRQRVWKLEPRITALEESLRIADEQCEKNSVRIRELEQQLSGKRRWRRA